MKDPEKFDAFYKDARDRLLVQTYCLTGDVNASRRAVRDAFVAAWHRWRKVSALDEPEKLVRPHAWRLAQRRHTARVWHRERDIDPEVRATLEALGKLTVTQRKALLLTQLAAVSMPEMARELGLTLEHAENELQAGVSQLSLLREVQGAAVPTLLEPVATSVIAKAQWPRPSIVRRAGAARRRMHTAVGVVAAVAGVVVSGSLVTDATGVRPTLLRAETPSAGAKAMPAPKAEQLPDSSLVTGSQLSQRLSAFTWDSPVTDAEPSDNGVTVPCQPEPFADDQGEAALVRTFDAEPDKATRPDKATQDADVSATQLTEVSRRERAAERAYRTTVGWFAECGDPRVQLLATNDVPGVGDESVQVVLRSWDDPGSTYVVGIARSGLFTTTTFVQTPGTQPPNRANAAGLLSDAVTGLCGLDGAGDCPAGADPPEITARAPVPVGQVPALLSVVDLPPVDGVEAPWAATNPRQPKPLPSVTSCAPETFTEGFRGSAFSNAATRSFLIPDAGLSDEFGLTETVASLPGDDAAGFLGSVRDQLAACSDKQLGTDVRRLATTDDRDTSMSAWQLDIRVTQKTSLTFFMAVLRSGTSVGQIGYVPAGESFADGAFADLAAQALVRLGELPAPKK